MKEIVSIVDEDVNARIIAETLLQSRGVPVRSAQGLVSASPVCQQAKVECALFTRLQEHL
jgi:hypothetical protein